MPQERRAQTEVVQRRRTHVERQVAHASQPLPGQRLRLVQEDTYRVYDLARP